jgi:hypothetical protein
MMPLRSQHHHETAETWKNSRTCVFVLSAFSNRFLSFLWLMLIFFEREVVLTDCVGGWFVLSERKLLPAFGLSRTGR